MACPCFHILYSKLFIEKYSRKQLLFSLFLPIYITDDAELSLRSAVHLSYLTTDEQKLIDASISEHGYKVDMKKSERLQDYAGKLTSEQINKILSGEATRKPRNKTPAPFKLKHKLLAKYFSSAHKAAEVEEIIDKALEMYFAQQHQQNPESHEKKEDNTHESVL
ncbi:hypothetical protein [Paenibacillus terrae]|uniref:ParB domain-containing protein nuclease n=2 Tax=Paenibacillus terrae TaxID=159743 RepID=G7VZK1_PAETH|nr:ParB domain-containing protein nuclease [Paenibacillus terrae HPL-003]